jgi:hypothetical protein
MEMVDVTGRIDHGVPADGTGETAEKDHADEAAEETHQDTTPNRGKTKPLQRFEEDMQP